MNFPSRQQLQLVRGSDGLTLLSSGVVMIAESWEFVNEYFRGTTTDRERGWRLKNTLNHEAIHFIQAFTTPFAFMHAMQFSSLCDAMQKESRRGGPDEEQLRGMRKRYRDLGDAISQSYGGVSTEDLLEGMAVVEGYRASSSEPSNDGLRSFLKQQFPGPSTYSRVVQIIEGLIGSDKVLDATGPICFLALNSDSPPRRFWKVLRHLVQSPLTDAWSFAEATGASPGRFFVLDQDASKVSHPVLGRYLSFLRELHSDRAVFEFCARPGTWLRGEGPWRGGELMPPVVLAQGGMSRPSSGPLRDWSDDDVRRFMRWVACLGAGQRALADGRIPYMACAHKTCPVYPTGLCHHWYGLPEKFEHCSFPVMFQGAFGRTPIEAASCWNIVVH